MVQNNKIVFSTDAFPERSRFSAYREELAKWSCGLELSIPDQFAFHAELELRRLGSVEIMTNTISTIETIRTPRLVRDGDDALLVMLLLHGRGHLSQFGEQYVLDAGDTVVCDSGYPGALNLVVSSKILTLKIPRIKLGAELPRLSRFSGAKLDSDPVARRLLSSYLSGTLDLDLGRSLPAAQLHQDHLIDLVALALGAGGEMRAVAEQRGAQALRRAAVLRCCGRSKHRRPIRLLMPRSPPPGSGSRCAMFTICWKRPGEPFPNTCLTDGWRRSGRS